MRLVLVELEKLRTIPKNWLLFVFGVLVPLPIAIVTLTQSSDLQHMPQDALDLVAISAIISGSMAAVACAREFEQRTIAISFVLEPRQERVIAAKAVAAGILGVAMAALFCAVMLGVTAVWLSSSGTPWPWTGLQTAKAIVGAVALTGSIAVAGTGFGAATRHVGVAISLLLVLYFVVEAIFDERLGVWHDYGVTAAASALIEPATVHVYGFVAALGVVVAASLIYIGIGIPLVGRADV